LGGEKEKKKEEQPLRPYGLHKRRGEEVSYGGCKNQPVSTCRDECGRGPAAAAKGKEEKGKLCRKNEAKKKKNLRSRRRWSILTRGGQRNPLSDEKKGGVSVDAGITEKIEGGDSYVHSPRILPPLAS